MAEYKPPSITTLREFPTNATTPAIISITSEKESLTLSHTALRHRIAQYATTLFETVPAGSPVAIVMPNTTDFIISFMAVTSISAIAAPLNSAYTLEEFKFYLSDAEIHTVIVPSSIPEEAPIRSAAKHLNIPVLTFPTKLLEPPTESDNDPSIEPVFPESAPTVDTVALFLHTSGTTSRPKGVPLTHENLTASIRNIASTYELTSTDRTLLVMPLFHVHGLMAATLTTLATGGCVIIPPGGKFSATKFWPCIVSGRATWYTAVPTMHQILLSRADDEYPANPPSLRFIRSCSASLAPAVLTRLEERFSAPVLEAYAMTEASHQMTSNPLPKYGSRKPGSVGLPQNVEVAILNENNEILDAGNVGEVCIRGDNVTIGYKNNPSANEVAFAGGWFHTGDQGSLDEDGYLTLTGRIKELVNRGGEKISPLEVDAALLAHPMVKEAVSFAVPDEKYGEEVNAAVITKGVVTVDELTEFALEKLAKFKVPKRLFLCDDLPRTATGKIQRRIVAKHFLDKLSA